MKVSLDGGPIYLLSANCEQYKCIECSVNAIRPCIQPISASFCLHFKCNFDFLGLNSAYLKSTWHCTVCNEIVFAETSIIAAPVRKIWILALLAVSAATTDAVKSHHSSKKRNLMLSLNEWLNLQNFIMLECPQTR